MGTGTLFDRMWCRFFTCGRPGLAAGLLLIAPACFAQLGQPTVWKLRTPEAVQAGDPVLVTIHVQGYSGTTTLPVPFDGVLAIDRSGSMDDNDPNDKCIDAAQSFVNCVAPDTRLAIVEFDDNAELVLGLTSDKPLLLSKLNDLRDNTGGGTSIHDAMVLAQNLLIDGASPDRERFIILLTDGCDNSGHTEGEMMDLARSADSHGIVYYTILLGTSECFALLYTIADLTEGEAFLSPGPDNLAPLYGILCSTTSTHVRTRNIVLREHVNTTGSPHVRVVPGSVLSSAPLIPAAIQQFEETGHIDVAMGNLGTGEEGTLTFHVVSECLTPDADPGAEVTVNIDREDASHVTYAYGLAQGSVQVPQASFLCRTPGDLKVEKFFDPATMELNLRVINMWLEDPAGIRDNSLRNIVVLEAPSDHFQPDSARSTPRPNAFIPSPYVDWLVWSIPSLAPRDTAIFSTLLASRVCSGNYHPPIAVNVSKSSGKGQGLVYYTAPGGERKDTVIPYISTTLPLVEECPGRHDLFIVPAYEIGELEREIRDLPPENNPADAVTYRDESRGIWIDSDAGNGLWDQVDQNVGSFIRRATWAPGNRVRVVGQGDLLTPAVKNVVYVMVSNTGKAASTPQPDGLIVDIRNHVTQRWEPLAKTDLQTLPSERGALHACPVAPNTVRPEHLRPYRLAPAEILRLFARLDPVLHTSILTLFGFSPATRSQFLALPPLTPAELDSILGEYADQVCNTGSWPNPVNTFVCSRLQLIRQQLQLFLIAHPDLAWGKTSIVIRAVAGVSSPEKHSNNNTSTEIAIVRTP